MPLTPGQLLAHYRIESKIGEGGMGEVWAATDTRLNRSAAIKALPQAVAEDPERLARFKREAQFLAALSHPNIAAIYGLEEVESTPYLALELVEGDDLSARIGQGPLPVDEAIEIATQIAAALEAAHDKGIVHRDLKPTTPRRTASASSSWPRCRTRRPGRPRSRCCRAGAGCWGTDPQAPARWRVCQCHFPRNTTDGSNER